MLDERSLGRDFRARHAENFRTRRRGFGFWTWKPHVIGGVLDSVATGDTVIYCDAGCSLNAEGRDRLEAYLAHVADDPSGFLTFSLDGTVGEWTKRWALVAFGCDTAEVRGRPMISATCLVLRKCPAVRDLMAEWATWMADLSLVDDSPSPGGEHPEFLAHRHDQSVFSLLAHERSLQAIPDETWWPGEWDARRAFPIHARRWRQRLPWPQWWMRHVPWPRW